MLSQTVEYALRAVVCLARQPGDYLTTAQLSEQTQVPPSYLSKVMQSLTRAGIATAIRGIRGGYALAVAPSQLTLLQVVDCIDPLKRIEICPLGIPGHGKRLCPLHRRLDQLAADARDAFARTTLSQIIAEEENAPEETCRRMGHGSCSGQCDHDHKHAATAAPKRAVRVLG